MTGGAQSAPLSMLHKNLRREPSTGFLYGWLLFVIFIDYARPSHQLPFLNSIPFFYSIPPFLLFTVTLFTQGLRPAKEIFADKLTKWLLFFLFLVLLSYALQGFSIQASDVAHRVVGYTVLFFTIVRLATTPERVMGIILALVVAHMYILGFNFNVLTNPSLRQYLVAGPFLGDGNDFALSIGLLFPASVGIALLTRSKIRRYFAWGAAAVIPLALVASQSRGATLGLAATLAYLWWRSSNKMVTAVAIGFVGLGVLAYAPSQYYSRMGGLGSAATEDSSAKGRLDAWGGSIGMGVKNPLGIGIGRFSARWGRTAHSTYFLALGELGVLGFACVLMLILGNIRANVKLRKALHAQVGADPPGDASRSLRLLDMINASLVYFAVTGAFLSATYYPHIYVLTGLLIAAREFARRDCQKLADTVGPDPAKKPKIVPPRFPGMVHV
jgi:putative inorganic carbon (HCO3(-)) transporter